MYPPIALRWGETRLPQFGILHEFSIHVIAECPAEKRTYPFVRNHVDIILNSLS
jgi:hypothetical protein